MKFICKEDDQATGHTDIEGTPVIGTVVTNTCSTNVLINSKRGANSDTEVFFASHAHALDEGSPIDFRSHSIKITASGTNKINGLSIALNGDIVPVADEAGPNATMVSTTSNVRSS